MVGSELVKDCPIYDLVQMAIRGERGEDQRRIAEAGLQIIATLLAKNSDYGGSAWKRPVLKPSLDIGSALLCRMSDKVERIARLSDGTRPEVEESLADTVCDLAGYSILWLARPQEKENDPCEST